MGWNEMHTEECGQNQSSVKLIVFCTKLKSVYTALHQTFPQAISLQPLCFKMLQFPHMAMGEEVGFMWSRIRLHLLAPINKQYIAKFVLCFHK